MALQSALLRCVNTAELAAAAAVSRAAFAQGTADAYDHAIVALAHSAAGDYVEADVLFTRALALERYRAA